MKVNDVSVLSGEILHTILLTFTDVTPERPEVAVTVTLSPALYVVVVGRVITVEPVLTYENVHVP